MSNRCSPTANRAGVRSLALSTWDNEGGAGIGSNQSASGQAELPSAPAVPPGTELAQLRARVIALENVMISLLSCSSDRQLDLVRDMSIYISPRPGFTRHPLTIHAATDMLQLIERARHFRDPEGNTDKPAHDSDSCPVDR